MQPPADAPCEHNLAPWREYALSYLRGQLGEAAPAALGAATLFTHCPLEGEGPVILFGFEADRGGGREPYYVAVGRTEPNYYPAYGLDADDAYSLHLGTRFMLVMGVAQRPERAGDAYDAAGDARAIAVRVAGDRPVEDVRVAATFDVDGQLHSVLRARLAGEEVYIMGRDAPPGFSRRTDLPPQVVYRLHLGVVLRREPIVRE
jgi:hypothetical protein